MLSAQSSLLGFIAIAGPTLDTQNDLFKELVRDEPELQDVVGFCSAGSAASVGRSIADEFYRNAGSGEKIYGFFTGQLWDEKGDTSAGSPLHLRPADLLVKKPVFACWGFVFNRLYANRADENGLALVLEAQWPATPQP